MHTRPICILRVADRCKCGPVKEVVAKESEVVAKEAVSKGAAPEAMMKKVPVAASSFYIANVDTLATTQSE